MSSSIPNPLFFLPYGSNKKVIYNGVFGKNDSLQFLFIDNKLVGVLTFFNNENVLPQLQQRYGNGNRYTLTYNNNSSHTGIIWRNPKWKIRYMGRSVFRWGLEV